MRFLLGDALLGSKTAGYPPLLLVGNSEFCVFYVFGRFSAKLGPKTPLERRGSSCSAGCTRNQPRRPILRPCRGFSVDSQTG